MPSWSGYSAEATTMPGNKADSGGRRGLVVFAHPDDAEFTCGGTLALWSPQGSDIFYAVCTDGSKGSDDGRLPAKELVLRRQAEQQEAAKVLGG